MTRTRTRWHFGHPARVRMIRRHLTFQGAFARFLPTIVDEMVRRMEAESRILGLLKAPESALFGRSITFPTSVAGQQARDGYEYWITTVSNRPFR